jgi:16S rRNA (guanine527-N7)-methyltransferase
VTSKEIENTLRTYGFVARAEYCERVRTYIELLLRWNTRVSLTTVTGPGEVVRFHFGESLMGIKAAGIETGRLADVGSGAGFPGVPIAMAIPSLESVLIESNAKKAAFLSEVIRALRLENVSVYKGRAERVPRREKFDFVAARALGRHKDLLEWATGRLNEGGKAILWVSSEGMAEVRGVSGWTWEEAGIPGTRDRRVAVGSRV